MLIEWQAWNVYPDSGDVTYPNNSEFFNIDDRDYDTYYRSWIYHNILGNFNYLFIEDMAGVRPRGDDIIELDPIDFGYDHFMVNNISYHGQDLTIVWDDPTDETTYYDELTDGFTLYVDGNLVMRSDRLAQIEYDPSTGSANSNDPEAVITNTAASNEPQAIDVQHDDQKVVEMLKKSGIETEFNAVNYAEGATVTASYTPASARAASWADKHRADGNDSTSKAVNEMAPTTQAVVDGMTVNMPFWVTISPQTAVTGWKLILARRRK